MTRILSVLILSVLVSGCAKLNTNGKKVKLSHNKMDAENCSFIKKVYAYPPYHLPTDWKIKLRNAGAEVGANLVISDPSPWTPKIEAKAYTCSN